MRVKQTINVRVAEDADMEDILFGKVDNLAVITHDEYTQVASGTINITQNTNEDLPLGDIDNIRAYWISVDQACELKFNGGTEIRYLVKSTAGNAIAFANETVTAINIAAPVDEDVTGTYCLWGD